MPPLRQITSFKNPALGLVRSLESKRTRRERRLIVVEGEDLLNAALDAGLAPVTLLVDAERVDPDDPILRAVGTLAERYAVPTDLMKRVSTMGHAARIIAVVPQPTPGDFRTVPMPPSLGVWLAGVGDPGNVGTLVRTSAAFGCDWVALGPGSADASNPKAVRAAMGATFRMTLLEGVRGEDLATRPGLRIVAGVVRDGVPYWEADLASPCIVALGSERAGIEDAVDALGDSAEVVRVTIPQSEGTESLNVAAAGAVLLAEARRQRAG